MASFDRLINISYRAPGIRNFDGSVTPGAVIWNRDVWARLESNRYYSLPTTGGQVLRQEIDYSIRFIPELLADSRLADVIDDNGHAVNLTSVSEPDGTRRRFLVLTTER